MPNIELHGYGDGSAAIQNKIRTALKDSPDAKEMVTTIYSTVVTDLDGKSAPFLRVISGPAELDDLLERLEPLGEDIEHIPLGGWIPRREATERE